MAEQTVVETSGLASATPHATPPARGVADNVLRRLARAVRRAGEHAGTGGDAVAALVGTRSVLAAVADIVATAQTMVEAAEGVLEVLCDDTWPVAHLYLREGAEFVDSGHWSSRTHRDYPEIVEVYAATVARLPVGGSPVTRAMVEADAPVWLSLNAGSPGLGCLDSGVLPSRVQMMRAVGLATGMACPVIANGQVVALLELLSPHERRSEPDELETMRLVGALLSRVAEREAAAAALAQRQELTRAIQAAIPDTLLVFDCDTDEIVEYSGEGISRDPRQVIGQPLDVAFPPGNYDYGNRSRAEVIAAMSAGESLLLTGRGQDGAEDRLFETYRSDARVGGRNLAFIFVRDVSDRRKVLTELEDVSSRARALLETADAGIFEVDPDGRIDYANVRGACLVGVEPSDIRGREIAELVPFLADFLDEDPPPGPGPRPIRHYSGTVTVAGKPVSLSAAVAWRSDRTGDRRTIVTVTDVTLAEQAARLATQHAHALEINDSVVQGLTAALYGLDLGETDIAVNALGSTLAEAKQMVATLLSETGLTPEVLRDVAARANRRRTGPGRHPGDPV